MVQHTEHRKHRLHSGYQIIFDYSCENGAAFVGFADKHGDELHFPADETGDAGPRAKWEFTEPMSAFACCYTAMVIGQSFGLPIRSSSFENGRLKIFFSEKPTGFVTPDEIVLNQTMQRIAIKLPEKKITTTVGFAPAANLPVIAEIMAALHGFTRRHVANSDRTAWHRPRAES